MIFFFNFSSNILFIIPYQLTEVSNYNTFRDTGFTKFQPLLCQGAVILQGEIIQGKPKICVGYFSKKFQDNISNFHTYTHIHMDKPKPICPIFFKVGGITMSKTQLSLLY